jgi:hypothetical protein
MWSQRDGRLSTITKVKVLSLEMLEIELGESVNSLEARIAACANGEYVSNVPGSESMVGNRIVCIGTWESHIASQLNAFVKLKKQRQMYCNMAFGLTHSRGVDGVMPIESLSSLEGVIEYLFSEIDTLIEMADSTPKCN